MMWRQQNGRTEFHKELLSHFNIIGMNLKMNFYINQGMLYCKFLKRYLEINIEIMARSTTRFEIRHVFLETPENAERAKNLF